MTARIIDGKAIAAELRARVAAEVTRVKREHDLVPGLAVVLVGNDPARLGEALRKLAAPNTKD